MSQIEEPKDPFQDFKGLPFVLDLLIEAAEIKYDASVKSSRTSGTSKLAKLYRIRYLKKGIVLEKPNEDEFDDEDEYFEAELDYDQYIKGKAAYEKKRANPNNVTNKMRIKGAIDLLRKDYELDEEMEEKLEALENGLKSGDQSELVELGWFPSRQTRTKKDEEEEKPVEE